MVKSVQAKKAGPLRVALPLLVLLALIVLAAVLLLRSCGQGQQDSSSASPEGSTAEVRVRTLAEVPQADFLSIFVYDAEGGMASFLVGGKTDQFNAFTAALAGATPVEAVSDASFSDLIIASFGSNDTLEMSYSRQRNLIIVGDKAYAPAGDLAPMVAGIEQQFTY